LSKDVTERIAFEERLKTSEAALKSLFDSSLHCIFLLDRNFKILAINKLAENITENIFQSKATEGQLIFDCLGGDDKPLLQNMIENAFDKKEAKMVCKHSISIGNIWLEYICNPIISEDQSIQIVNLSVRDVTDVFVAEEDKRVSEANLSALIENTDDFVWSLDVSNKLTGFNRNFRIFYRDVIKKEVEIGMSFDGLRAESEKEYWDELREKAISGKRFKTEYELKLGRNTRIFELSYNPVKGEGGKLTGGITIQCRDITLNKKIIKDLVYKNHELDTFVYKVSHDLIGPIASMKGLVNIANLEIENPSAIGYFNMINERVDRLHNIVLTLIQLTRIKEGVKLMESIDYEEIIKELFSTYRNFPTASDVDFSYNVEKTNFAKTDSGLLKTILQNLVENAIKYKDEKKKPFVKIHVFSENNGTNISVEDNGTGIEHHFHEKIFNMFFRADLRSKGSGLGLYIVKNAIEKLDGTIDLKSVSRLGTSFQIFIPNN